MMRIVSSTMALAIVLTLAAPSYAKRSKVKAPTKSKNYVHETFKAKDGTVIDYWLMSPKTIDNEMKYPLVLALHGRGGNVTAATALGAEKFRKQFPCFVMAPAVASKKSRWASPRGNDKSNRRAMLPVALEALDTLIKKHPIDADRVYVVGQSMGGFGSFGALALRPDFFAGAIPVAGGWNPNDAKKIKHIPVWVFHGDKDKTVPVKYSRDMVEAIKKAGGSPKYTEYKGVGHNSWSRTFASSETWNWLFQQKRNR